MSIYLPPILHNRKLNTISNSSDFNYQNSYLTYLTDDMRYVISSVYTAAQTVIDTSLTTLNATVT